MFRASVIPVSKELIKEANSVLYNFIWNGKDKVKRLALISDMEMGGLKMLDIQSMICAKRITCLKKLLEDYSSPWKVILDKLLLPHRRKVPFHRVRSHAEHNNTMLIVWHCRENKSPLQFKKFIYT